MNKYYAHASGGVGDLFAQYFGHHMFHTDLSYITAMKRYDPRCHIKLISHIAFPEEVKSFFKYHPYINEIQTLPWINPNVRKCGPCLYEQKEAGVKYEKISLAAKRLRLKKIKQLRVFTNKQDNKIIKSITNKGPFVFLHPFSSSKTRIAFTKEQYETLVSKILQNFKCNIVIVGKSHVKEVKINGINKQLNNTEQFDMADSRIINLIDKVNLRISSQLAFCSKVAIVNRSLFNCLLSGGVQPGILLKHHTHKLTIMKEFMYSLDHLTVVNTSINPEVAINKVIDDLRNRILLDGQ